MAEFEEAYSIVKRFEGGWCDVPGDRGGETYAGIARNFFPRWEGWAIVDSWKAALAWGAGKNLASQLTRALAAVPELQAHVAAWYRSEWWERLGLSCLPQKLANEIFEQAVNLGKAGAGKKIQILCNAYNLKAGQQLFADLALDGAIGPKTLGALRSLLKDRASAEELVHALNCLQGTHYLELAAKKPEQRKFTSAWMKRTHCEE